MLEAQKQIKIKQFLEHFLPASFSLKFQNNILFSSHRVKAVEEIILEEQNEQIIKSSQNERKYVISEKEMQLMWQTLLNIKSSEICVEDFNERIILPQNFWAQCKEVKNFFQQRFELLEKRLENQEIKNNNVLIKNLRQILKLQASNIVSLVYQQGFDSFKKVYFEIIWGKVENTSIISANKKIKVINKFIKTMSIPQLQRIVGIMQSYGNFNEESIQKFNFYEYPQQLQDKLYEYALQQSNGQKQQRNLLPSSSSQISLKNLIKQKWFEEDREQDQDSTSQEILTSFLSDITNV